MKGETNSVIIAGFSVDENRILQSVFIIDEKNMFFEMPISDDYEIDKEKLKKELIYYYRKEVEIIIDLQNDWRKTNSNWFIIRFVGIK